MNGTPCETCPFAQRMFWVELAEACEGVPGEVEMLCHESACLDGDKPDTPCQGFLASVGQSQI
jgi:hypothetical protein